MHYTTRTVPREYGPNPMTAFATVARVGDTFETGGLTITVVEREPHGPYTLVTLSDGMGGEWSQDYLTREGE